MSADSRRDALVLASNEHTTVMMNRFPYAHAHLMIAPRKHTADFAGLESAIGAAVHRELQRAVRVLTEAYSPGGFNVGMNLGRVAGAGIADHLHWHVVPRWEGDTNFMPVVADVRVLPEALSGSYEKIAAGFKQLTA